MPIEQSVEEFFPVSQASKEKEIIKSYINELVATGDKLGTIKDKLSLGGLGFGDSKKAADELSGTIKNLSSTLEEYKTKLQQAATATQSRTASSKELTLEQAKATEATKLHNLEMRQQAKDALATASSLQKLKTELALATGRRDKLIIDTPEFEKAQKEVLELTNRVKALQSASGDFRLNVGNYPQGSFNGLKEELKNLLIQYGNLTKAEQKSVTGVELKGKIDSLTKSVGEFGDKSGNAFGKAYTGIRTLANILPGLGISGIFLLAYEGISAFVTSLNSGNKSLNTFAENYKNVTEVVAEANKKAGAQIGDLKVLYTAATDVTRSIDERKASVKALKEEFPDYFGKVDDEIILNGKAKQSYDDLAKSIISSSRASAAKAKIDDLERQRLDVDFQRQKIKNATANETANAVKKIANDVTVDEFGRQVSKAGELAFVQAAINKRRVTALREQDLKEQSLNEQEKFLVTFAGEKNITKVTIDENTKREKARKPKEVKDIADALSELQKTLAGIDEKVNLNQLTPKDADIEKVKAYGKAISDIYKTNESQGNKRAASLKLKIELDPIDQRVLLRDIEDLVAKVKNKDRIDLLPPDAETQKRFNELRERLKTSYKTFADDEAKFNEERLQRDLVAQETAALKEQDAIEQKYNSGKLSRTKYERALLDIQLKYAKEAAETAIKYLEVEIKLYGVGTKAREDAEKRLASARLALNKNIHNSQKEDTDELIANLKEIQGYVNDAIGIVGGLIDISVTKQKNALRELEDQQQKNYDNQVDRINKSTLTEAQKADQVKILEAQRQAQKDTFDRKNREADLKKAAFDKATAISNIIFSTAVAVIKALPDIVLAAVVGAIGAAQLAIAIATPLPKYATGVMNKQSDSFGIAGEAGAERVERPGYAPIVVDKETAMFMPRGTNVIPLGSDKINGAMYLGMMQQQAKKEKQSETDMLLRVLVQEAKKKKPTVNNFIVRDTATYQRQKQKYYGQA